MSQKTLQMPSTYIEAGAMVTFGGLLKALPLPLAARFGEVIAMVLGRLANRPGSFVEAQMRTTFGNKFSDREYKKLRAGFFRHIGCLLAEGVRLKSLNRENVDNYIDWNLPELEPILAAQKESGLGTFMTTGHIGNWEFTGAASALKGYLTASIARPLDNPLLNRIVNSYREHSGQKIWTKQGAITNMLRAIKRGDSIGILVDQDGGDEGLQVPFLGRPASTVTALADLSIRSGGAIFPAAIQRIDNKPMKFKANLRSLIFPDKTADKNEERLRILREMNNALSSIILDAPEQWLWTHRRWKTPNPRGAGKQA